MFCVESTQGLCVLNCTTRVVCVLNRIQLDRTWWFVLCGTVTTITTKKYIHQRLILSVSHLEQVHIRLNK